MYKPKTEHRYANTLFESNAMCVMSYNLTTEINVGTFLSNRRGAHPLMFHLIFISVNILLPDLWANPWHFSTLLISLLVFFCSSVPVVLFDTPGISRCRSQHVSVESSSLLHHSIYLWFICLTWWSIDELENLHADRTTVCFEPWFKLRARLGARKTGLSPPVFLYWPFQGGTSVVVPYCSCCLCLYFGSSIMLVTYFVNFR